MKIRLFIRARTLIAAGIFVALCSSISWPIGSPSIYNPVDYSTLPPSSYEIDAIRNPVKIDINGNLVITGNVRRGMHFRDTVPYDSTTSFRGDLGSSSLNSFLRDSAGTEDLGRSVSGYGIQPYYLRSRTVATTRPGYSGVFGPTGTRLNSRRMQGGFTTGTYVSDTEQQILSSSDTSSTIPVLQGTQTQYKAPANPPTIVNSIRELKLLTQQAESNISAKDQQLMIEKYRKQNQEIHDKIQETEDSSQKTNITFESEPATEIEQKVLQDLSSILKPPVENAAESNLSLAEIYAQSNAMAFQDGTIPATSDTSVQDKGDGPSPDIIEQVKKQLEDLTKTFDDKDSRQEGRTSEEIRTNIGLRSDVFKFGESPLNPSESIIDRLDILKWLPQNDSSTKTRNITGSHDDPDSFPMYRFNLHFKAGEDQLKNGDYYAAADSFALASIFKRNDPLCLAGRSHALLAAGEYISSALFLSRAIKADPEFIKARINLAADLGGQHIIDSRIADIKEWLLQSGSGQLNFLLGYVYYRMGRLGPAQKAINAAHTKQPHSKAIAIVKKAVDDALAGK